MAKNPKGHNPYEEPARPRPSEDLVGAVAMSDDGAPGADVVIPADTVKAEPRVQDVPCTWVARDGVNPRASGRMPASAMGGMLVRVDACPSCGGWYPVDAARPVNQRCPRCEFASLELLPVVAEAMMMVRWKLNEWHRWKERDRDHEHNAFLDYREALGRYSETLLLELERLHGNQVTAQVHDALTAPLSLEELEAKVAGPGAET